VFLPTTRTSAEQRAQAAFADARPGSTPIIAALAERIRSFLEGEAITFGLELVAFERCTEFQRSVLIAEHTIPRGWVSTYGRIARRLGVVGGARAVGSALAKNPFPIIIPCHRAIRSGGALGGYQGGLEMKRALLELEGIEFSEAGKVLMRKVALA
jgi:methylated-DNA-[protein]-cysteine S-methyltransferase